jgi:hypothetical protein
MHVVGTAECVVSVCVFVIIYVPFRPLSPLLLSLLEEVLCYLNVQHCLKVMDSK